MRKAYGSALSFGTLALAAVSLAAPTLAGCGFWPSFPASLLDGGGTSRDAIVADTAPDGIAPSEAGPDDGGDVVDPDAAMLDVTARETSTDDVTPPLEAGDLDAADGEGGVGPTPDATDPDATSGEAGSDDAPTDGPAIEGGGAPGGFRMCTEAPPAGPFVPEMALMGEPNSRDLAFDGMGRVATGDTHIVTFNAAGMRMQLTPDDMPVFAYGMRYLPDGALAVGSTRAGVNGAVRVVPSTGSPVETLAMNLGTGSFIATHPNGSIYVSDSTNQMVLRFSRTGERSTAFMLAMGTLSPTGLAISPDGTRLYVGSTVQRRIYEVTLGPAGVAVGAERTYADGLFNGQGLAFDECGRLYVTDRDRGRILRVPAGGGTPEVVATRPASGTFAPWGLAFGRGTGFMNDALYTVDSTSGAIYRIPVGVPGAALPGGS